jgi:hypothetical protein
MVIPSETRTTAADLSETHRKFLDFVEANREAMQPLDFKAADLPPWVLRYTYPLQSWPTFVGGDKLREIRSATLEMTRLVKSVFGRIFDYDPRRISDFYEIGDESLTSLLFTPPNGIDEALSRCDFIDTLDGIKFLEVNMGGYLGGWQPRFWEQMCRSNPTIARFLREEGVEPVYQDPFPLLFAHLADQAIRTGICDRGVFNTALVVVASEHSIAEAASPLLNELYASVLRERGLVGRVLVCTYPTDFWTRRGEVYHIGGDRVHALVEYTDVRTPPEIFRCFKAELVSLYNGPLSTVLGDKRNLALLYEHLDSEVFSDAEREFIRKYLPWSRHIPRAGVLPQEEESSLRERLLERKEQMVLKRGIGARGDGIIIGGETAPQEWEDHVRTAFDTGAWLAQERIQSRPYLYQNGDGCKVHDVVWGTFSFGSNYAGGFLRMIPRGRHSSIINSARGATEGFIFEV